MTRDPTSDATYHDTDRNGGAIPRRMLLQSAAGVGLATSSGCLGGARSPNGDSDDDSTRALALETGLGARPSVLEVGAGTGWVVDDGLVLTCSHVVESDDVPLETFDGRRQRGTVVERHDDIDLAVIETEFDDIEPLAFADDRDVGDRAVVKVGHPDAVGTWIVSFGRVVRTHDEDLIAEIPCGPGDSGSPLLTLDGGVLGHVRGSTTLVEDPTRLDRPETLVQDYEGQRHASRAHSIDVIEQVL